MPAPFTTSWEIAMFESVRSVLGMLRLKINFFQVLDDSIPRVPPAW